MNWNDLNLLHEEKVTFTLNGVSHVGECWTWIRDSPWPAWDYMVTLDTEHDDFVFELGVDELPADLALAPEEE